MHSRSRTEADCLLLHILPSDGIGGVETAARTAALQSGGAIRVHALARSSLSTGAASPWITEGNAGTSLGPAAALGALRLVRRLDPDAIVFSLWRSFIAFLLVKLFYPRKRLCLFLHCSISVHVVDRLCGWLMMRLADEIWADSEETLRRRVKTARKPSRVISMVLHAPTDTDVPPDRRPTADFICWCRLADQKRLDRALLFIAEMKRRRGDVRFTVIGPDMGLLEQLRRMALDLGLVDNVEFVGPQDRAHIEKAAAGSSFFLQLSTHEGQSMAVVEAMQLGLVPVVTPVGMIPEYCIDGVNGVIFRDNRSAADRVERLLADPAEFQKLSQAAREQFARVKLYTQDVLDAACGSSATEARSKAE